jgi:hypothetical protein
VGLAVLERLRYRAVFTYFVPVFVDAVAFLPEVVAGLYPEFSFWKIISKSRFTMMSPFVMASITDLRLFFSSLRLPTAGAG